MRRPARLLARIAFLTACLATPSLPAQVQAQRFATELQTFSDQLASDPAPFHELITRCRNPHEMTAPSAAMASCPTFCGT